MTFILWNDGVSIGDVVYSFPGTLEYAKRLQGQHGFVALHWTNNAAGDLFPHEKYGFGRLWEDPTEYGLPYDRISFHDVVHRGGPRNGPRHGHPTAVFMAHLGFPELSDAPIKPEIIIPQLDIPTYDVIIAPYVLADIGRMWPIECWQVLVDWLRGTYPSLSIAVIAGTTIPAEEDLRKINPYATAHFYENQRIQAQQRIASVDHILDRPLAEIAYLLSRARLALTVDSGPARMMHGIGTPHVLLAHNTTSFEWCTYPGAKTIYGSMLTLEPSRVIEAIRRELEVAA